MARCTTRKNRYGYKQNKNRWDSQSAHREYIPYKLLEYVR
nr:MAG TPA: hypothetical protein [Caudoviricetes sp.]